MGLDPNNSYVVVISGEAPGEQTNSNGNPNSRMKDFPAYEYFDGGGGGSSGGDGENHITPTNTQFEYVYEGTTYTMRHVVVTATDNTAYNRAAKCDLLKDVDKPPYLANFINTAISMTLDEISGELYIGTIASILGLDVSDFATEYTETSFETLTMFATASWTRVFTQVYSSGYDQWFTSHHVEYAYILTSFGGHLYNVETGLPEPVPTQAEAKYIYSRYYHNHEWRMEQAVLRFRSGVTYYDLIGSIHFTYNGEVVMTIREVF